MNKQHFSSGWRTAISVISTLMLLPGIPLFAIFLLVAIGNSYADDGIIIAAMTYLFGGVMVLFAGMAWLHAMWSRQHKPSAVITLPSLWLMAFLWAISLFFSLLSWNERSGSFYVPLVFLTSMLPPLMALAWFAKGNTTGLTWRRGSMAFCGGSLLQLGLMAGLFIGSILFISIFPDHLFQSGLANILTNPNRVYLLIASMLIMPLVQELTKPLVIWLLLPYLDERETFLVGGMVGVGFITMGTVLSTFFIGLDSDDYRWLAMLLIYVIGSALHPLSTGIMAVGWHNIRQNKPAAKSKLWSRYGGVVAAHSLWNGSAFFMLTLLDLHLWRIVPEQLGLIGYVIGGGAFVVLVSLSLITLWVGQFTIDATQTQLTWQAKPSLTFSDRVVAIWAFICFLAIVPPSIIGLFLWR